MKLQLLLTPIALCLLMVNAPCSHGVTKTWSPFLNFNDWNNDLNWSPLGQPTTNDDVVISLANDFVLLNADTAFVNSLLLTNGADLATNGATLFVDDATETAIMTIGNAVGLSRLEIDSTSGKAADIDQLVINNGGQLDMDGGLIEIDTFLDANTGAEIVGRGTIELAGIGMLGRAAILDGTILVEPAQTMIIRSTGGGTVDLDGGSGTTSIAVADGADLIVDAVLSDAFDGQITLGNSSRLEVTQPWTLAGRLSIQGHIIAGIPLEEATIEGGELTVSGTLEILDQAQITVNAPVNVTGTRVILDEDSSNLNPNPLLMINGPATWNNSNAAGNGTLHFTQGVEVTGQSIFSTVVFIDNQVTGPGDLIVGADSRAAFLESAGGLREARIVLEPRAQLWSLPSIGSLIHTSSIRLADGSQFRHNGAEFNGTITVESGEAEIFMNGDSLIGRSGERATILSGSAGRTLRFDAFSSEVVQYGTNVAILGNLRLVHDADVLIRGGPIIGDVDLSNALLEFAESEGSESNLRVDGGFVSGVTTLASGTNSQVVANVESRWRVNDSLFVGGSTTTAGGVATLNLIQMPIGGVPRLEVANQLRIYGGSSLNIDGGHLETEFLLMDSSAALSFLDGTLTVAGGTATLPGTGLSFGTQANKEPEFLVTDGSDVAVPFSWRMATTPDGMARTEVTGKSPINAPSKLRNTGGGGGADLVVGQAGFAQLLVAGGGNVDFSDDVILGDLATAIGTAHVDGVANGLRSTMRTRGGGNSVIYVGRLGSGSLDVTDGALVSSAGDISIADQANSSGQLHVFQTGSPDNGGFTAEVTTADDLFVGGGGFGNLLIDSGGLVEVGDALIINNAMSRLEMSGGTFRAARFVHTAGGTANLNFGRGEVNGSGTTVTLPLVIGDGTAAPMELVVTASGSAAFRATTIASNGTLEIGGKADVAELSVDAGGKLLVSGRVDVDLLNSTPGTYALEGGTLAVTQTQFSVINNPVTVAGISNIEVPTGGSLILGGIISGSGGAETLVKTGPGALALRGTTTLAGPLVVQSGRLLSDADSLPVAIENNAELVFQQSADGMYAGSISGEGALIKDSRGLLALTQSNTYTGDTLVEAGTLRIQQAYLHDFADVHVNIDAVLSLDFVGVDTINALFLDGVSQPVGTFGSIGSGAIFESERFSGAGILEVTSSIGLSGDYNADGVVDGSDFLIWQRGGSSNSLSAGELALWQANYGSSAPPPAIGTTVPEPSAIMLALAIFVLTMRRLSR